MIVFAAIVPHPPESIPGVGTKENLKQIQKTLEAFEQLRIELEQVKPETLIIISPHARMEPFAFTVNSDPQPKGGLDKFGLDLVLSFENDLEITDKIVFDASMNDIPARLRATFLDHGALIPLYHLTKNLKPKIVHLAFSLMDYNRHFDYGGIIQLICDKRVSQRVAIIASGALSHKLTEQAPAGFSPTAKDFDRNIVHLLGDNDLASLLGMNEEYVKEAAECGMRSILILLGALQGKAYKFKLLSYEGPYGVGYLCARLL